MRPIRIVLVFLLFMWVQALHHETSKKSSTDLSLSASKLVPAQLDYSGDLDLPGRRRKLQFGVVLGLMNAVQQSAVAWAFFGGKLALMVLAQLALIGAALWWSDFKRNTLPQLAKIYVANHDKKRALQSLEETSPAGFARDFTRKIVESVLAIEDFRNTREEVLRSALSLSSGGPQDDFLNALQESYTTLHAAKETLKEVNQLAMSSTQATQDFQHEVLDTTALASTYLDVVVMKDGDFLRQIGEKAASKRRRLEILDEKQKLVILDFASATGLAAQNAYKAVVTSELLTNGANYEVAKDFGSSASLKDLKSSGFLQTLRSSEEGGMTVDKLTSSLEGLEDASLNLAEILLKGSGDMTSILKAVRNHAMEASGALVKVSKTYLENQAHADQVHELFNSAFEELDRISHQAY